MTTAHPDWTPAWTVWTWVALLTVIVIGVLAIWSSVGPYLP